MNDNPKKTRTETCNRQVATQALFPDCAGKRRFCFREQLFSLAYDSKARTDVDRSKQRVFEQKEAKETKAEALFSDSCVVAHRAHRSLQMKPIEANRDRNLNLCYLCLLLFRNVFTASAIQR